MGPAGEEGAERMHRVAVLGFGTVGKGVAEMLRDRSALIGAKVGGAVELVRIADIRDFPGSPFGPIMTKDAGEVFADPGIGVVVETIGGTGVAYEFTKRALGSGKHVVTSNKELVASKGPELLALARERGVRYMFEASVGGGIPIIRPMARCLAANGFRRVMGILNGTTNYILTMMAKDGAGFDEALRGAQDKGYAEADSTADVDGGDACRKLAILSSLAYGGFVDYADIPVTGIRGVAADDMRAAEGMGGAVKLMAYSAPAEGGGVAAFVAPVIVTGGSPLYGVDDVFNAITVTGDAVGDVTFRGRGAGAAPTASAVVGDVMDVLSRGGPGEAPDWDRGRALKVVGRGPVVS
ncbi:MAG: homoserine dehydrogenase, partial [Oscillospiraceae bacterium]|nr:homoserine dehydrogenase [Oscillospiraceae bacterium]